MGGEREGGRESEEGEGERVRKEREGEREGGRESEEGERERVRKEREGEREGGRERGRERGRKGKCIIKDTITNSRDKS